MPGTAVRAPTVRIEGASLRYGGVPVFENLALTLPGGEWTCLLGQSGVGKTSLLRLIAGLADGAVGGRVASDDGAPLTGRVTYMGQQDLLFPWLTVLQNVTLGRRLRGERDGVAEAEARAQDLLALVGLAERAEDRPGTLSGGMRQRAALARTLMEDRPVVLMDEPFSALDAITRHRLQDLAAELLAARTVLLVTHDPLEALRLGHSIQVLAGRPARSGLVLTPEGNPPRPAADSSLLALHGALLARLADAEEITAGRTTAGQIVAAGARR